MDKIKKSKDQSKNTIQSNILEVTPVEDIPPSDPPNHDPDLLAQNLAKDEDLMRIVYYKNLNILNKDEEILAKRNMRKVKTLFYQKHFDENIGDNITMWQRMIKEGIPPFEKFKEQDYNFRQCWSFQRFQYSTLMGLTFPNIRCLAKIHTLECPTLTNYGNSDFGIRAMFDRHDPDFMKEMENVTVHDIIEALTDF